MFKTNLTMIIRILLFIFLFIQNVEAETKNIEECQALSLAKNKSWDKALQCAYKQKNTTLVKLVKWLYYQNRNCDVDFEEISEFIIANPNFPDIDTLVKKAEERIDPNVPSTVLIKWFRYYPPSTANGIKYYTQLILPTITDQDKLIKTVKYSWINGNHNSEERKLFLTKYNNFLSPKDHIAKINSLLSKGNKKIESDLLSTIPNSYKDLIRAKIALSNDQSNFARIIRSVPANLRNDPSLLYAEAQWLKQKGHFHKLAKILYDNRQIKEIGSDSWFKIRTSTIAELIDTGNYKLAYILAKTHNYKDLVNYVDGEWLAGRIAYFYLHQPKLAIDHFENIFKKAKYSVSKAKGAYWSGMAAKKMKNLKLANEFFTEASKYPDTFYGQLAIMYKNKDQDIVLPKEPEITNEDLVWFENDVLVKSSKLLIQAKEYSLAEKFMKASIQSNNKNPTRILLVVRLGYTINLPRLSLTSGKEAARSGTFLAKHIYPTLKFTPRSDQIEKALMLSIIRQESAFDPSAVSSAEAMGLMQLIYPTAKDVGKELNIRFRKEDLVRNPKLNLTFGCHHLSKVVEQYDGSYILAAAAYNAGPGNVNKWIIKYGDPRKFKNVEQVVNWIEKVPFYETRGYIQNVLANLQLYRGLLKDNKTNKIKVNLDKDLLRNSNTKLVSQKLAYNK
jgi:soluble lytic murein transglycosylase